MDIKALNSSVVIISNFTPISIHPNILKEKNIIPLEWEIIPDSFVSIPPITKMDFTNKYSISMEINKLQITNNYDKQVFAESKVADIANKIIEYLKLKSYIAIGYNFTVFFKVLDHVQFFNNYIYLDKLNKEKRLENISLNYTKKYQEKTLHNIGISLMNYHGEKGISIKSNYHTNVSNYEELLSVLDEYKSILENFYKTVSDFGEDNV